ncbi:MAG: hypothetical protein ABIN91_07685 [Mucilaginibacter sp.]|uniref:hypothetical protein n=1 Tax=Mucilaginibacter sp. TaxID=1882438 RepID=UPI00326767C4
MKLSARLLLVFVVICFSASAQKAKHPFNVYGFIVYGGYMQNGNQVNASYKELQTYQARFGLMKYDLIYERKMLDFPNGDKANGVVNLHKMDSLAILASQEPAVLVSLDLEEWKRFDTLKTPHRILEAINIFRKTNSRSKIGLYATVPQNTYGYDDKISRYDKWNQAYAGVAAAVDYFSPSLYNYKNTNGEDWKKAAAYSIDACRKYGYPNKKIIPYVTPEVSNKGVTTLLNYDEMLFRLQTLYDLGADGCLIWTSSGTRDANGKKIYIDENSGWFKAVKDFATIHSH